MRPTAREIEVHLDTGSRRIPRENVYFAFPSGRLAYNCQTCGSKCCRGFGFNGVEAREIVGLIEGRRLLPLFVEHGRTPDARDRSVVNLPPSCFFLDDDGRCDVQVARGYDAKPETCRLFPFNSICVVGNYLVVTPHRGLCPLEVSAEGAMRPESSHALLLDTMAHGGLSNAKLADGAIGDVDTAIARERAVVALSERFATTPDWPSFVDSLIAILAETQEHAADARRSLQEVQNVLTNLFGAPAAIPLALQAELASTMIAFAPHFRSLLLFPPSQPEAVRGMRLSKARALHWLWCLHYFATAAVSSGMKRVTYQSLTEIERAFGPVIEILAQSDLVMTWQSGAPIDLQGLPQRFRRAAMNVSAAILSTPSAASAETLGRIILAEAPAADVDRVLFVKDMARRLVGRIVETSSPSTKPFPALRRQRAARALQRFIIRYADADTRLTLYDRLAALGRA